MNKEIPKKVIDVTGVELTPATPRNALEMVSKVMSVVAMSVTTFCFVFPNMM